MRQRDDRRQRFPEPQDFGRALAAHAGAAVGHVVEGAGLDVSDQADYILGNVFACC